ncbi:MAG: nucleotide exchange factor GrpE [Verrucomicrobiota bacterium]
MSTQQSSTENSENMDTPVQQEHSAPQQSNADEAAPAESGIGQIQADLERFRDLALRSQADFENYRKRAIREREEAVRFANFSFVEKIVPVLDSFELGLAAARSNEAAAPIVSGMEMVRRQLDEVLHQFGVEAVDATGHPFDPNLHEAVAQEPSSEVVEGSVVRQLRKGYRLKDRLVRAALVVVSGGPA